MHGGEESLEQNFEYLKEMDHSESLSEFGRIILKWILTVGLWKNKTSNSCSTGYIFAHIFYILFSTSFMKFSCLDRVKHKNCFYTVFQFSNVYVE